MKASDWIALAAVLVSPAAVLAGAFANSYLAARNTRARAEDRARQDALKGLAEMKSLLLDAEPSLILKNELGEYLGIDAAVQGLYSRWLMIREPLVLLSVMHPSEEVRDAAVDLQAEVEVAIRMTGRAAESPRSSDPYDAYTRAIETASRLGKLLSPYTWPK